MVVSMIGTFGAGAGERVAVPAGAQLLLVEDGVVAVVVTRPRQRRRLIVAFAAAGDVIPEPPEGVTLEVLRPARLRVVDPALDDGSLVPALTAALLEREESLALFADPVNPDRVLAKLIQLAGKFGRVTPTGIRIDLPLTHHLMAEAVGAARETVTVALRDLHRSGAVAREGRSYVLKLPPDEL